MTTTPTKYEATRYFKGAENKTIGFDTWREAFDWLDTEARIAWPIRLMDVDVEAGVLFRVKLEGGDGVPNQWFTLGKIIKQ